MTEQSKRLDWAGARTRLERIQNSLDRADVVSPDHLHRIYQERAQRLAQSVDSGNDLAEADMLLVFRLGEERYAFRLADVTEVLPESKLAPVPGAPPFVAGVIQVRGEIRPVYNLQRQLGLAEPQSETGSEIILVRTNRQPFGVRVDAVDEIRAVIKDDRRLAGKSMHVEWMTDDLVGVLNTGMLGDRET